jgi:hypothetical protein
VDENQFVAVSFSCFVLWKCNDALTNLISILYLDVTDAKRNIMNAVTTGPLVMKTLWFNFSSSYQRCWMNFTKILRQAPKWCTYAICNGLQSCWNQQYYFL